MYGRTTHAIVDLRTWESTYMGVQVWELNEPDQGSIYIPAGCAHGFYSYDNSGVICLQQGVYDPESL